MSTLSIPGPNQSLPNTFTVLSDSTIRYNGQIYSGVTSIKLADGTIKTCAQIISDAGGTLYTPSELKRCFKIEGFDPDSSGRTVFSVYTNNSRQTSKNETASVPGGMWSEVFNFLGTRQTNNQLQMLWAFFSTYFPQYLVNGELLDGTNYSSQWIGFRMIYGTADARSYVLTYIDDFIQESVPCPPVQINVGYMDDVKLQGLWQPPPPSNTHYFVPIRFFHLYRTSVGASGAATFRRVVVDPVSQAPNALPDTTQPFPHTIAFADPLGGLVYGYYILDNVTETDLSAETLQSTDWDPPPFRGAMQLVGMWNGMMAMHVGTQLLLCEPFRPHAWPAAYRISLPWEIISKAVEGNSMLVTTTGPAYLFTGTHPSSITYEPVLNTQAGKPALGTWGSSIDGQTYRWPARSICTTPIGVVYAADDGLIVSMGGRSRLLTSELFTKEEWQQYYGSRFGMMRLAYVNDKIIIHFGDNPGQIGAEISLDGKMFTQYLPTVPFATTVTMPGSEGLFGVSRNNNGNSLLLRIDDPNSPRLAAIWKSRRIIVSKPLNFGCFQIMGSGVVTVYVVAGPPDGSGGVRASTFGVQLTLVDGLTQLVRLPSGYREREWVVALYLSAGALVKEFYLAETPQELAGV